MSGRSFFIKLAVVGIALVVIVSVYLAEINRTKNIRENCTATVGGYVVSCETRNVRTRHNRKMGDAYVIEASYQVGGVTYFAEGTASRPFDIRDSIGVNYDPDDPGVAYVGNDPVSSKVPLIVSMAVGIPVTIVLVLGRKK